MGKTPVPQEVLNAFQLSSDPDKIRSYGSGHINDTYLLEVPDTPEEKKFILQRINKSIFAKPEELMENITGITKWLRKKIVEAGQDPERGTLNVRPTASGKSYFTDTGGEYWRVYNFIKDTVCYDQADNAEDFYQTALSFGNFQHMLADYPAQTLHETIPDFHNTPVRYDNFEKAVKADAFGRVGEVQEEISFVRAHKEYVHFLTDRQNSGELPLRVTHNDTKLNNILIDNETGKGICVIDLDTVMPGLAVYDFGDSIRFGTSTAAEDEQDLTKVSCNLEYFEVFTKGFIEGCAGALTQAELNCLIDGAIMMTLECGIRFLTDHLEGDHYFKIHRENHNLDRARTQFKLVQDMEDKRDRMEAIVKKVIMEVHKNENL